MAFVTQISESPQQTACCFLQQGRFMVVFLGSVHSLLISEIGTSTKNHEATRASSWISLFRIHKSLMDQRAMNKESIIN